MSIDFNVSDEGVALITINRPERLNAMDAEHYAGLSKAWMTVRDDPAIRVAIVTGAGEKSFTTGADIKSFITTPTPMSDMWMTQADQLLNRGLEVWKPVISAINGYCLGGGVTLMMATDIRIAATHATFNLAEVKRGVIAGLFFLGYGLIRVALENVREPDVGMPDFPLGLTMGMILSLPMILGGSWLIWRGITEDAPATPHGPA